MKKLILMLSLCLLPTLALALPFNDRLGDITPGTTSDSMTLQQVLDANITGLDAVTDQSLAAIWKKNDVTVSTSYAVAFVAGHDTGYFGIYSKLTGFEYNLLHVNDSDAGLGERSFKFNSAGDLIVSDNIVSSGFGTEFGFYWNDTLEPYFSYTEDLKNTNVSGTLGDARALTYQLADETLLLGGLANHFNVSTTAGGDDWILAFADHPGGDYDYNDAVFLVSDISPVPEPGTLLLLGSGLIGLAFLKRRKQA